MASPFPFQPPPWLVEEVQRRAVLLINHVLMQEAEAQARLARQSGKSVHAAWRSFSMRLMATPAGLFEMVGDSGTPAELTLTLTETSPFQLAQTALKGDKPPVHIAGDVQFAAEINWLVDHVRWDLEEDLARVIGDAPAHAMGEAARRVLTAMRDFVAGATAMAAPSRREPADPAGPGNA